MSGTQVLITESDSGYSVAAWFIPPGINGVFSRQLTAVSKKLKNTNFIW
ncbi:MULTISPECIES: hypothetical protein [Sphaerospermopsis]|jgi:hypothetical protein|uniref:Uncharacterized protein n=1 Tax=Sphaerospermopsis torques-reginae ITEP-024 TaxID=984208 RepID=A0ABX8WW18_9CYAN|nr:MULTISPECIES: hypothetical protein [Sphaerospermopsis]MBE9058203.1 hypothetical protein [Sphaerospermopsis sp. LEGE 08334]QYX30594.1 hypothetical protein K2F26_17100 [Sphaerospermopsis torques-reginae ITEP-024]